MKKQLRCIIFFLTLLLVCTSLFGCSFSEYTPSVLDFEREPEVIAPTPTTEISLDFESESDSLIDIELIEKTVSESADGKYPSDISVFNYVLNRELFSRYADTDLKKELVLGTYSAILTSQKKYTFPTGLKFGSDDLKIFMNLLDADAPELFNLDRNYKYYTSESVVESIEFSYYINPSEYLSMLMQTFAQADEITGSKDNDYETELYVHDNIIKKCTYTKKGENISNAYGAIAEGKALCEGYSDAFTLCLFIKGIKCIQLWGTAVNNEGNTENHAWNLVKLNGKWYQTDITWDDFKPEVNTESLYAYFNLTDEKMYRNHTLSDELANISLPKCKSEEYNYHVLNSNVVKNDSNYKDRIYNKLDGLVSSRTEEASFILAFESETRFNEMNDNVESIFRDWASNQIHIRSMEYNCTFDTAICVIRFDIKLHY